MNNQPKSLYGTDKIGQDYYAFESKAQIKAALDQHFEATGYQVDPESIDVWDLVDEVSGLYQELYTSNTSCFAWNNSEQCFKKTI